jgi:hypothetical protein
MCQGLVKLPNITFHENSSSGSSNIMREGTNGQTWRSLQVHFCNASLRIRQYLMVVAWYPEELSFAKQYTQAPVSLSRAFFAIMLTFLFFILVYC